MNRMLLEAVVGLRAQVFRGVRGSASGSNAAEHTPGSTAIERARHIAAGVRAACVL
jgi:hypothetical protein